MPTSRKRLLTAVLALPLLGLAPASWAASAGAGTDDFDIITACAVWSHPSPPAGKTVTVSVCGEQATNKRDMIYADEAGPDRFTNEGTGYGFEAVRSVCDVQEPHLCERNVYQQPRAAPEEVAIDVEAGTARLRATIRDCSFDVTVDATLQDAPATDPDVHPTVSTTPLFMFTSVEQREREQGAGPAVGSVCDWDDVVIGEGDGTLTRERKDRVETYVFPFS